MSYILRKDFEVQQRLGISAHYLEQRAKSHFKNPDEAGRKIEFIKEYLINTNNDPWQVLQDFNNSMPEDNILRISNLNSNSLEAFRRGDPVLGYTPFFYRQRGVSDEFDFDSVLRPLFEWFCLERKGVEYSKG